MPRIFLFYSAPFSYPHVITTVYSMDDRRICVDVTSSILSSCRKELPPFGDVSGLIWGVQNMYQFLCSYLWSPSTSAPKEVRTLGHISCWHCQNNTVQRERSRTLRYWGFWEKEHYQLKEGNDWSPLASHHMQYLPYIIPRHKSLPAMRFLVCCFFSSWNSAFWQYLFPCITEWKNK